MYAASRVAIALSRAPGPVSLRPESSDPPQPASEPAARARSTIASAEPAFGLIALQRNSDARIAAWPDKDIARRRAPVRRRGRSDYPDSYFAGLADALAGHTLLSTRRT